MPDTSPTLFCIDMGTTRTRLWLTKDDHVYGQRAADFGARDVAAHHNRHWLSSRLCALMDEVLQTVGAGVCNPRYAVAAGMITSAQGVRELPHAEAPASAANLAAGMRAVRLMQRAETTLILVPGVRTGSRQVAAEDIATTDLMRGEETLCIGLLESGILKRNMSLLNLGSHWKWIAVDRCARIASSRTTLTGEMIHAVQSNSLLAASVSPGKPHAFDMEWVRRGLCKTQADGLGRALFCVRLLDSLGHGTPEERLSYLYGAFLADEIQSAKRFCRGYGEQVLIAGSPALAVLWRECLQAESISAIVVDDRMRDAAYLKGLQILAKKSGLLV